MMRSLIIAIAAATAVIHITVLGAEKTEGVTVFLGGGDHVTAESLTFLDGMFSLKLPYVKALQIDREHVLGLAYVPGKMNEIVGKAVENDTVKTTRDEVLSGIIESITDEGLKLRPSFAPENISTISLDRVSCIVLSGGQPETDEKEPLDGDMVKVIFLNGDLLTGKVTSFFDGEFEFEPLRGSAFSFGVDEYQTIHNANTSKQFIEEGLAAALLNMIKNSGSARSYGNNIFVALIRAFIKSNDIDGAVYFYEHLSDFNVEPYIYRQLADEFYRNELYELAIKAYELVFESNQRYYYDCDKLISSYEKLGRKAEAAKACERFLENEEMITRYNKNPIDLHLRAADLYMQLDDFAKAAEHLETVIDDPNAKEYKRSDAREKLIGLYKERGKLDTLIANYRKQLEQHEKTIGEGIVLLITRYTEQGKLTKAAVELERLRRLGMEEFISRAEEVIPDNENSD